MQEAAIAAKEMQKAFGNLLDFDGSVLSGEFLQDVKNLDLMKEAINGNETAYQQLQEAANKDIIAQCKVDTTEFNAAMADVQNHLDAMNFQELKIGADLDDGNFLQELTRLVNAAGMTAAQAEAYLGNMGIDAKVVEHTTEANETQETASFHPELTKPVEVNGEAPVIDGTTVDTVSLPYKFYGVNYKPDPDQVTTTKENKSFSLEVQSAHKKSGGNFKYQQASHGGGGRSPGGNKGRKGGGGGGGGGAKKKEVKQPKEHVKKEDRYHDIKEQLDDVQKAYDKVNKAKDRAFGKSKLKYLDQEIDLLKQEDKLLKQYVKEIEDYAKKDLESLTSLNIGAKFDDTGKLLNYEEVLKRIVDDQNAAIDKFNQAQEVYNKSAQSEADKEILERAQKELEAQEKVAKDREEKLKQYNDTYNL